MKKLIFTFFIFFIALIILYSTLLLLYGITFPLDIKSNLSYKQASYGHTSNRLQEVKTKKNIDLLFLGSSHTYRGFDNRIFENEKISCFNLGSSSQTPLQTEILLQRYLQQLNPKLIVFEVYPETFCLDGVESSLDIFSNDGNDLESIKLAIRQNNLKVYNTLLFSSLRKIVYDSKKKEPIANGYDTYIKGGFVAHKLAYFNNLNNYKNQQWEIKNEQTEAFERIVNLIKKCNITLLLVMAPVNSKYYNSFTNNLKFDSIMKRSGDFYNFNTIKIVDDSLHFYDKDHLNQNGVILFNKEILKIITTRNEMKNKNF